MVFRDPFCSLMGFRPRTLLFGPSLAVLSYNAVARLAQTIFVRPINAPLINYFDDFAGAKGRGAALIL